VAAGYYTGTLVLNKSLVIRGGFTTTNWVTPRPTQNATTVDAQAQGRVIHILGNATVTISGLYLTGGSANTGGGIYNQDGTLTLEGNNIYDNHDTEGNLGGGGIANGTFGNPAALIMKGNRIYSNTSSDGSGQGYGGGISIIAGSALLEANEIYSNTVEEYGGGIMVWNGQVAFKSNLVYNNTSTDSTGSAYGGGVFVSNGNVTIENDTLYQNAAKDGGGGIYVFAGTTAITNALIIGNTATMGGGIYSDTANLSVAYTDFYGNAANHIENAGGPIDPTAFGSNNRIADPQFVDAPNLDLHISSGSPARDSGTASSATVDFEGNGRPYGTAMDRGADEYTPPQVCYARPQDGIVYASVQEAVNAATDGDTVQVAGTCMGTVSITKTLTLRGGYTATNWLDPIYGPTTLDGQGLGRAIYADSATGIGVTIENLRIVNGTSGPGASGGGIYLGPTVEATLHNNVIYNNAASLLGGGVYNDGGYTEMVHNTVYSNAANVEGGGVYISGTATLANNIVAGNPAGGGISAPTGGSVVLAYNDFYGNIPSNYGSLTPGATDISAPPEFLDAGSGDFHLALTSPAVNAADPASGLSSDFEGEERPLGARADMGADESRWYTGVALGEASNSPLPVADVADIQGELITFTHAITNVGRTHTLTDAFTIIASNGDGWPVTVDAPIPLVLTQGDSESFAVVISVPITATEPLHNQTFITATSLTNPTGFDTVEDLITGPGLEFTPSYSETVSPGEAITYTHTLTNTGPTDTFTLEFASSRGWGELVSPSGPITLTYGETAQVIARVYVTDTAPAGPPPDVTTIKATSSYAVDISAVVTDTTTVGATTGNRYVAASGGSDTLNNCKREDQPCATINHAVLQATHGDSILVAQGTYYQSAEIQLNKKVDLYGGYIYDGDSFSLPGGGVDPATTIIDAPNGGRGLFINVASAYHPVVDGFTIRDNGSTSGDGGAVYVQGSSAPTLTHLILIDTAAARGGAIYIAGGAPVIQNVAITRTTASGSGGGIYVAGGAPIIRNVSITGTQATADGAGIYIASGGATIEELRVMGGTAGDQGGGVYQAGGSLTLSRSRVAENSAAAGGGIYHPGGTLDLWNTFIYSNTASGAGGGVHQSGGTLNLVNDTLHGNRAATLGGGIYDSGGGTSVIYNTIVVTNSAGTSGGGIYRGGGGGSLTIDYNDVWGNAAPSFPDSNVSVGLHSIAVDPLFENARTGDLHIAFESPCNDVADPNTFLTVDIDGDIRPSNQGFDIGADELAGCLAKNQRTGVVYGVLQDAIDEAEDTDEIRVSGTCQGVQPRLVNGQIISQTAFISRNLTLAGGYDSTFSNDPESNPVTTTLDARGWGRTLVITGTFPVEVSRFTLVNGDATGLGGGPGGADAGGALYNHASTLTAVGLILADSQATYGGGAYNIGGQIRWYEEHSAFTGNAAAYGGGIYLDGGAPLIDNVDFVSNSATQGGGIYNAGTTATLTQTYFISNTANLGGAVYNAAGLLTADAVSATHNTAGAGGAFYNATGAQLVLQRGTVLENTASGDGGGLYNAAGGDLTVVNTFVVSNTTGTGDGGGLYNTSSQLTVRHCTFYANDADGQGGGIYHDSGSPLPIVNSTLIVNNAAGASGGIYSADADPDFDYNDVYGNLNGDYGGSLLPTDGTGNMSEDPLFVSTQTTHARFLRLAGGSPAEDTGDPNSPVMVDIENEPRPSNRGFDIGADDRLHVAGICAGVNPAVVGVQTVSQTLFADQSLTVQGGYTLTNWTEPDPELYPTALDALGMGRVVYVTGPVSVTVAGLHLRGGSGSDGGAVFAASGTLTVTECHIYLNSATDGAALYNEDATVTLAGSEVYSNTAVWGGGAYNAGGELVLDANIVRHNEAATAGGGFYQAGGDAVVHNNIIWYNLAPQGGGVYGAATELTVQHNTFYGNEATDGGGLYTTNSGPTVVSNIFYNDEADAGRAIYGPPFLTSDYNNMYYDRTAPPDPSVYYAGGVSAGPHTFFDDPLLVNAAAGDFHVTDASPVIDAGDPTMVLPRDYEGDYRPADQGFDIGADERKGCWARIVRTGVIYGNPQLAIDHSIPGDVIQITVGECRGVHPYDYDGDVVSQTVHITHSLTLNGGFARDFASGGDDGPAVYPDEEATTFDPLGRGRAVLVADGVAITMTRFILINGDAGGLGGGPLGGDAGGAFYYAGSGGILEHVDFYSSTAAYGGAFYSAGDDLGMYNSWINYNTASADGGGIYNASGAITVTAIPINATSNQSTRIYSNTAGDRGGGLFNAGGTMAILDNNVHLDGWGGQNNWNSALQGGYLYNEGIAYLANNTIFSNSAEDGGAIYNDAGSLDMEDNEIHDNAATHAGTGHGGGGLFNAGGLVTLDRGNRFYDNTSESGGGAIHNSGGLQAWNTLIYNNSARTYGGGVYFAAGSGELLHNTFYANAATAGTGQGGGIYVDGGSPIIKNTIFYSCTTGSSGSGGAIHAPAGTTLDYNDYYSNSPDNISGGASAGTNSLYDDPDLVNPGNDDFHLRMFSPLIDVGEAGLGVSRDFENDPRPINLGPDIGADEYNECLARVESTQVVYGTIQEALDNAASGDTIRVAEGTCYESIVIDRDVTIDGSWEKDFSDHVRNSQNHIELSTLVDAQYEGQRVATINSSADSVSLSWLILLNGDAGGNGGGIWSAAGDLTVSDSLLMHNGAANGGGVYIDSGTALLQDTTVYFNTAGTDGGGIYVDSASEVSVRSCIVEENQASSGNGGGAYYATNSDVHTTGCGFYENTAHNHGGGLYYTGAEFTTNNSSFVENTTTLGSGGGIFVASSNVAQFVNVGLIGNVAQVAGGGLYRSSGGSMAVEHATIRGNRAETDRGGGIYNAGGSMDVVASIIAFNDANAGGEGIHGAASVHVDYSLQYDNTYGGSITTGSGNIEADPRFRPPYWDVLHHTSPAIDAVPTSAAPSVDFDAANNYRPQLCAKDMGRREYAIVRHLDWGSSPIPGSQTGDPGETVYYIFELGNQSEHWINLDDEITNLGPGTGYTETVVFSLASSKGWAEITSITGGVANTVIMPGGITATTDIAPGYTATVHVEVSIPPDAYASLPDDNSTKDLSRLTYQAYLCYPNDTPIGGVSGYAITSVSTHRDFEIAPDNYGSALPGQTITYTHVLTNTGNITDTYAIIPWPGFYASAEIVQPGSGQVTLTPHQTATLVISVTVSPAAAGGLVNVSNVIARSGLEPPLEKQAADDTAILYTTGTRYVSLDGQDSLVTEPEPSVNYKDNNCTQPGLGACRTIQHAIDQAADGDLIKIEYGTYTDVFTTTHAGQPITQTAFVDKSVTLQGGYDRDNWDEDPPSHITQTTTIDPPEGRAFYVTAGVTVTLDRLTIPNADATGLGGGPSDEDAGGGVYNEGAHLTLNATHVYSGYAELGGGLYHAAGELVVQNSLLHTNVAGGVGGAVYAQTGPVTLQNDTFYGNEASDGSAVHVAGGALTISNTIFAENSSSGGENTGALSGNPATAALDYNLYSNNLPHDTSSPGLTIPAAHDVMADPLFLNQAVFPPDLRLQQGSPAREAGDPATDTTAMPWDYENNPRLLGHRVDIGAYEYVIEPGVEIAPDHTTLVSQGTAITYTHTLTNTGDLADTFDITIDSDHPSWVTLLTPISVTLTSNQTATVEVRVDVPSTGVGGVTDVTVVTAQSQLSPAVFDTATDTTEVEMTPGVILEPNRSGSADPGTVITYTHTLHNTGDGPDTYDLTHISSAGWAITYDTPITVGYGMSRTVIVSVTVPADAISGTVDLTFLTATSQHDAAALDSVTDATTVNQVAGVELAPDRAANVAPDTTIAYTHTITNAGNGADTFTLEAVSSAGWITGLSPGSVALAPDETYTVVVTITVPGGTPNGTVDTTVITATSQYDPSVRDSVTDTTTVVCNPLTDVTISGPTSGYTDTLHTFDGTIIPADATEPVVYTWTPTPVTGQGSSSAQYEWVAPGTYTVTLTAENCGGTVTDTHTITISATPPTCPNPLTGVTISGLTGGYTDTLYTFDGAITPAGATPPITYTWTPTPATGQDTSSAQYEWAAPGTYTVTLTVENCGGTVTDTHTITIETPPPGCSRPLGSVTISGPTDGYTDTLYTLASTIVPADATPPITYTWTPAPVTGQGASSAQYEWAAPGTYTVTLTAENCGGVVTDTHTITISDTPPTCPNPLTGVTVSGPSGGYTDTLYTFVGTPTPLDATEPIVYTWAPEPATGQGTAGVQYGWAAPGTYTVTLTVENCGGTFTDTHTITISEQPEYAVYLPLVLRNYESPIPNRPDLVVTDISVAGPVNAGEPVTVRVTVANQGDQPVTFGNNFYVDLYVDRQPAPLLPGNIDWGVQGSWFSVGISRTLSVSYTFTSGTHQLYAQADTDNSVAEMLENNNTLGPVTVNAQGATPDEEEVVPTPLPEIDVPRPTPTPIPEDTP
jgi:fibronectin-binding autotransporter adhesin